MNPLSQISDFEWQLPKTDRMRVPGIVYMSKPLVLDIEPKTLQQVGNVATLPGIVRAAYAMPDAHSGYGFPIGGVAAFDPDRGGVVSAGGVGFDISCGVRTLITNLVREDILEKQALLADMLYSAVPSGVGKGSVIRLSTKELDDLLANGAKWAIREGFGRREDLLRIEDHGCLEGADPANVSPHAKERQLKEMGSLGSGNHYLEVQAVEEIFDEKTAAIYGLSVGQILISIHCGSRGLGHQVATDYYKQMLPEAPKQGISLPDPELACSPIHSKLGQKYLGAMRSAANCALANRQIIAHVVREIFQNMFPETGDMPLLYDVSHNTCKVEEHMVSGVSKRLYVHRKGATRAYPPGHPSLDPSLGGAGQPVLVGGSMGTGSYILAGMKTSMERSFGSASHGAGRALSRAQAKKRWRGQEVIRTLKQQGIYIRSGSFRGVAEEAPGAYKNIERVADACEGAGLASRVARVAPLVCIKG